jgi:hypothetical protein
MYHNFSLFLVGFSLKMSFKKKKTLPRSSWLMVSWPQAPGVPSPSPLPYQVGVGCWKLADLTRENGDFTRKKGEIMEIGCACLRQNDCITPIQATFLMQKSWGWNGNHQWVVNWTTENWDIKMISCKVRYPGDVCLFMRPVDCRFI